MGTVLVFLLRPIRAVAASVSVASVAPVAGRPAAVARTLVRIAVCASVVLVVAAAQVGAMAARGPRMGPVLSSGSRVRVGAVVAGAM